MRESVPTTGISKVDYAANFDAFLKARPEGAPFYFWYGGHEPHLPYEAGSGLRAGRDLKDAPLPPFLPDDSLVRGDLLDYLVEVEWCDSQLGQMLARLEKLGELDRTLVVVTSDHGTPFPGAKANLYECGIHVPLAMRWSGKIRAGQTWDALISNVDLAPTFLEAAGQAIPPAMTGKSLLKPLGTGQPDTPPHGDQVLTGRERHTHARYDDLGYPSRAIRTRDYLYTRNFKPARWPAGDPEGYEDVDGSPTKTFMIERREALPELFAHAFGKRPEEELYDIRRDPACLRDLVPDNGHDEVRHNLRERLTTLLKEQQDPRVLGYGDIFESYPRFGAMRPDLGGFAQKGEYNPKYQPGKSR